MNWLLILILAIIAIVIFIKFKEIGHKTKFSALVIVLIILLGTIGYVYMKSDINLSSYDGFIKLGKSYFSWLGGLFGNFGKITGYAVQQEWGVNATGAG